MHIKQLKTREFRRFTDLTINIEGTPKLVVLCGPNGTGKSSLFDAIGQWGGFRTGRWSPDDEYFGKGVRRVAQASDVDLVFHESVDTQPGTDAARKAVYVRTAYRNDPEFALQQLARVGSMLEQDLDNARRMIENDTRVSENYQRLVSLTLDTVYDRAHDDLRVGDIREGYIGQLRDAILRVFPGLALTGPGDPLAGGTFRFAKGAVTDFVYKNLSGGEKATFDLILDLMVKRQAFDDTVFCIDEPEAHLNMRVQGSVLRELVSLINERSQLWVATHSIGMMREAKRMQEDDPASVAFLDFGMADFDTAVVLEPTPADRAFWTRTLDVALGDLASLLAPSRLVLCEGKPVEGNASKSEFDARCYRRIFGDTLPDTDFVSVGNSLEVESDRLQIGRTFSTVVSGTTVVRVVDRDHRSEQEVADHLASGVRVLSRRHLEAFLLDDEVLTALCGAAGRPDSAPDVLQLMRDAVAASIARGNDADDVKRAAPQAVNSIRKSLDLRSAGSTTEAFLADTLAPLIKPGTKVYAQLEQDIFG